MEMCGPWKTHHYLYWAQLGVQESQHSPGAVSRRLGNAVNESVNQGEAERDRGRMN